MASDWISLQFHRGNLLLSSVTSSYPYVPALSFSSFHIHRVAEVRFPVAVSITLNTPLLFYRDVLGALASAVSKLQFSSAL